MHGKLRRIFSTAVICVVSLSLTACSTTSSLNAMTPNGSDPCDSHREPLREFAKQTSHGSTILLGLLGAAAGGIIAAIDADNKDLSEKEKKKRIATGAGVGAVAVGTVAANKKRKDNDETIRQVRADIATQGINGRRNVSSISDSVFQLYNCRASQYDSLTRAYRNGSFDAPTAVAKKISIKQAVEADRALVAHLFGNVDSNLAALVASRKDRLNETTNIQTQTTVNTHSEMMTEYVVTAKSRLNVRERPARNAKVISVLNAQQHVYGGSSSNDRWIEVNYNGKRGFVSSSYVRAVGTVYAQRGQRVSRIPSVSIHDSSPESAGAQVDSLSVEVHNSKMKIASREAELERQQELADALIIG